MAITSSFGLRRADCFLSLLRKAVDVHVHSPLLVTSRFKTFRLFKRLEFQLQVYSKPAAEHFVLAL
jgi:hypothetical protein